MSSEEKARRQRRQSIEALRVAREHLKDPKSKLAMLMLAYSNGQEAGTSKWVLPEA